MIRIFLICDDEHFSAQLWEYLLLQPDFAVTGQAANSRDSRQAVANATPDILILQTAAINNFAVIDAVRECLPLLPIFLVLDDLSSKVEKEALSHNVEAVFLKQDDCQALLLNAKAITEFIASSTQHRLVKVPGGW